MAKKIEGAAIDHNGWIEFDQAPDEPGPWQSATLVIHEGKPERVYTQSEVDKLLLTLQEFGDFSGILRHKIKEAGFDVPQPIDPK